MSRICVELPLRLESEANLRGHWSAKAKRAKLQRKTAYHMVPWHGVPCIVTITRIAPRRLDGDNLQRSAKHVRDGIADRLRIDDGDTRIEWRYRQTRSARPKHYAVMVEIEPATDWRPIGTVECE